MGILMQIVGTVDLFVFPPNCSSIVKMADGFQGVLPRRTTDVKENGKEPTPFFHIRLKPGEGAVIPSGAEHKVVNRYNKRVGLNFFFEPRHGKMKWSGNPSSLFSREADGVLAARSLWMRS